MSRVDRRRNDRARKKRMEEIRLQMQAAKPLPVKAMRRTAIVEEEKPKMFWSIFIDGVPAWPYPFTSEDAAKQHMRRLQKEYAKMEGGGAEILAKFAVQPVAPSDPVLPEA